MAWHWKSPNDVFPVSIYYSLCLIWLFVDMDADQWHLTPAGWYFHIVLAWAWLKEHLGEGYFFPPSVWDSNANPSLITWSEGPKIHVSHCNMPQGYSAWQIESVSPTPAGLMDASLIFLPMPMSKEQDWWEGSCLTSCAHFLSARLSDMYPRDNTLKQTDETDWEVVNLLKFEF